MAAHSDKVLAFTVHVPVDATPGDHLAGIAFESATPLEAQGRFGVKRIVREVMGVLVTVTGPARPFQLHVSKLTFRPPDPQHGGSEVVVELANTGQLLGKQYLTVTADGPGGYHRTVQRQLDTILPGDMIGYSLSWPDTLGPGKHHFCASDGQGGTNQGGYCADVRVEQPARTANARQAPFVRPAQTLSWAMPALFLAGLALGGAVVALIGRRQSTNRKRKARSSR